MKHHDKFFAGIFFACSMLILNYAYSTLVNISIKEEKTRYQYMAINEANYISSCIDKVVVRTYTLREMLVENDGDTKFFEKIADTINHTVKADTGITLRNIAVAPNGVVQKVAPVASNESLVGFDLTDSSRPGNAEAMEAYLKEQTIITNPFSLVQGGTGMASRTPVFLNVNGERTFWGLVTATMDYDDIVQAFNFSNFSKMHVNYWLWHEDRNGEKVIMDTNATEAEIEDTVSEDVNVFNLKWHIDVIPEGGWYNENMTEFARIGIFVFSALVSALVILVFRIKRDGNLMRALAEQDSLTGCYSRHYLNSSVVDVHTGNWKNPENNYSVAIVDVDKFKQINDTYGHSVGDRALMAVSKVLKDSITNPRKDRVVRFGGDEFLVFYSNVERKDLRIKFQTILAQIEQIKFEDNPDLQLGVSIGVAIPEFVKSADYKEMMQRADENLYKVKENGRNNYVME
ncbi:MAG: sensor domain-containing diguanylate cyclase [Treponema sp.]|nr:sensor domain-containing diguanylate cyclase [Candidatus Treponema equifaecale]